MKPKTTLSLRLPRWWRPALAAGAGLVWVAFVVLALVPVLRSAVGGHVELRETTQRIAALDGWTGPRLLMARDLAAGSAAVEAAWARMYPAERGRERLFLDLARIADASGVEEFDLAEVVDLDLGAGRLAGLAHEDDEYDEDYDDAYVEDGSGAGSADQVEIHSYRVLASWTGDYRRTADFLARLRDIPRALAVSNLEVRIFRKGIRVELELEVFVDGATES